MILYKKAGLRVAELWYDEELDGARVDIIRHMQRTAPTPQDRCWEFHTILIDLSLDPELLFARMKKDTRNEIRRATAKDNLTYQLWTEVDSDLLAQFRLAYDQFARQRGLRTRMSGRLQRLSEIGALSLSQVRNEAGVPLVWHAYYRAKDRVRLLDSVSLVRDMGGTSQRSLLGRANRCHHWQDILAFRAKTIGIYDFGGWYGGGTDQKKLSINKFKEEFGGEIVLNYNCQSGLTLAGKVAIWLYARIKRGHSS